MSMTKRDIETLEELIARLVLENGYREDAFNSNIAQEIAGNIPQELTSPGAVSLDSEDTLITSDNSGTYSDVTLADGRYNGQKKSITFSVQVNGSDHIFLNGPNLIGVDIVNQYDKVEVVWLNGSWRIKCMTGAAVID